MRRTIISIIACVIGFWIGSALARYHGPTFWLKADMESING